MPFKMTCEPDDYEGPWPSEDSMTKPTVEQVMQLANEYAHCYSFVGDDTMPIKHRELRAAIEALAAPAAPQPDSGDLYSRLHSLSKSMEGRGHIDEDELPDAYPALLDAMAFVRGWSPPAEPQEHTGRWNIDVDDSDGSLRICKGEHEKSEACVYERYVPESKAPLSMDGKPAAPQQAEPVAWMFDRRYGSGLSFVRPADYENEDGDMVSPTPLYRHPPADEVQGLRDAAQDVCEWARASQWAAGEDALVPASRLDALLAALEGK